MHQKISFRRREGDRISDRFATFFSNKVINLANSTVINDNVYNGRNKVTINDKMFMDGASIRECIMSLKVKNSEGFDRIPQRILVDGVDHLLAPFVTLFSVFFGVVESV